MKVYRYPAKLIWKEILERPVVELSDLYARVIPVINDVKENGDNALIRYTKEFDGVHLEKIPISQQTIKKASSSVNLALKTAIEKASQNIREFHRKQIQSNPDIEVSPGVRCWQKTVPIEKVGLYVPGGSAPLLSTVMMLGIPAKLAGCREVILCTPPGKDGSVDPAILYTADFLGIKNIYSLGGAQAIAAMAYGTESVPRVNKIFGPGNQYVTAAKQLVSRDSVAIDMPAGPSELAVIADESANAAFVASDLLSQAEHGPDSQVMLVTDSESFIGKVQRELEIQLPQLPRDKIAIKALENSKAVLLENLEDIIELINEYAPEHLIIAMNDPDPVADNIRNAGSVFLGHYTPESAGDYASGTNHTLPTNGWAHAYSGLNMDAFVKKITFQQITESGIYNLGETIISLAKAEKLEAHSNAVAIRLQEIKNEEQY